MIRCSMLTPTGVTSRDFDDQDADLAAVWASLHAPLALAVHGSVTVEHLHTSDNPSVGTG